jgi:hypothetical protein
MVLAFDRLQTFVLAALTVLMLGGTAAAHSFNVTFLVPMGASGQVMSGFMMAATERDGHSAQESDGHLGGLDVYLNIIPWNYLAGDINRIVMESEPDIIVLLGKPMDDRVTPGDFADAGPWVMVVRNVSAKAEDDFLTSQTSFSARFRAFDGAEPDQNARLSYVAARLIDLAVRAQGGAADTAALARAVVAY